MEGAGMWDDKPCLVVKGVCDYADSHKNKRWQDFAAATAASVTRAIVDRCPRREVPPISTSWASTRLEQQRQAPQYIPFPRNEDFVPRPDLVAQLDELLPATSTGGQSAALWGLGGSGKTQLALNYVYTRRRSCSVFWVHAENEATFTQDFQHIARLLGLDVSKLRGDELLPTVRLAIEREPEWLLIVDNADNLELFGVGYTARSTLNLRSCIPTGSSGTILWTTRDGGVVNSLVGSQRGMEVSRMTENQARQLLWKADGRQNVKEDDSAVVEQLLEELQWLPLAIFQAGAYMRETLTSPEKYLHRIREGRERWAILNTTHSDRHRRDGVTNSVLETWHISIEYLARKNEAEYRIAYRILHTVAYLDNKSIPWELLQVTAAYRGKKKKDVPVDDTLLGKATKRLLDFSFLIERKSEGNERSFEMHKLVQEGVRYRLSTMRVGGPPETPSSSRHNAHYVGKKNKGTKSQKLGRRIAQKMLVLVPTSRSQGKKSVFAKHPKDQPEVDSAQAALGIMRRLFPRNPEYTEANRQAYWQLCEKYLAHALRILDHADLYNEPMQVVDLSVGVDDYLWDKGKHREEEEIAKRTIGYLTGTLGEMHRETLQVCSRLANIYSLTDRYEEAKEQALQTLDRQKVVLGERDPDTLGTMDTLARAYIAHGQLSEAEEVASNGLKLSRGMETDLATLDLRKSLGTIYCLQERFDIATQTLLQTILVCQKVLGETDPRTRFCLHELARIYAAQGRYREAETILLQMLQQEQRILGEDHRDTLTTLHNLAQTYRNQGKLNEAKDTFLQLHQQEQRTFGDNHRHTLDTLFKLAKIYRKQGQFNEAAEIFVQVLHKRRRTLGEVHKDTLRSKLLLSRTYAEIDRREEAVELMEQCVQQSRQFLGPDDELTKAGEFWLQRWEDSDELIEGET